MYIHIYLAVFDKLIWPHNWSKELLIWNCTGPDWLANYDYIVTNNINCLLIGSRCILNGAKTNYC